MDPQERNQGASAARGIPPADVVPGAFSAALDRRLLESVCRFNHKNQYLLRHMQLSYASRGVNTLLWLRGIPCDYLHMALDQVFRPRPEVRLRRLLRNRETQAARDAIADRFAYLYGRLTGDDRELLVHVAAMRILGPQRVRIPGNLERIQRGAPGFRAALRRATCVPGSPRAELLFDFSVIPELDLPMRCVMHRRLAAELLLLGQYAHPAVHAETGDVVLDCGAFKGETALWFACRIGDGGKVYAFEFVPLHAAALQDNLDRNPALASRIEIVPAALWSRSGMPVYCAYEGGGARISFDAAHGGEQVAETMTIDAFVEQRRVTKLDLIKMDIEGAEREALKGASQTLRTLKPKLAIAVYHRIEDFEDLPRFIDALGAGYRFHLGHHTLGKGETVLYATARA